MLHTTSDGLNLYYEINGNTRSEKTLVFLNGLSQSTIAWSLTAPAFAADYKIILLDFIFQGQSDKSSPVRSFDDHARDVKSLIDHLQINKAILIGISYGSLVAQHFALLFPEKMEKMVLMSTFAHKTPYYEAIETAWWSALRAGGYSLMLDVMLPTVLSENYFENPLIPIDIMKTARQDINTNSEALFKLMTATRERPDYREKLKSIKVPTLIIHGEKDLLFPVFMANEVHKNITESRFEIIPGAGHTLNLEAVPQTIKLIKSFLP